METTIITSSGSLDAIRGMFDYSPYCYYTDGGHGWLKVPLKIINDLGLKPSGYSFKDEEFGYLEEDMDMGNFFKAIKIGFTTDQEETEVKKLARQRFFQNIASKDTSNSETEIFIRRLDRF